MQLLPNLRLLGPRLGSKLPEVRAALQQGDVEQLDDGRLRAAGEVLAPDEVIRGERVALEGWAIAEDDGISVAFDTTLDDELRREGRVLDLVHALNTMRKGAGLELTDRIVVTAPASRAGRAGVPRSDRRRGPRAGDQARGRPRDHEGLSASSAGPARITLRWRSISAGCV